MPYRKEMDLAGATFFFSFGHLHLNREVKTALHRLGSNITDDAIQHIGKCVQRIVHILQNFDHVNKVPSQSGYHM